MYTLLIALLLVVPSGNDKAREGNKAYEKGDFETAAQLYVEAITLDPENARYYFNLGNALSKLGQADEATAAWEKFRELSASAQEQSKAAYNKGNTAASAQDWEKAMAAYREALRLNPDDVEAKHNMEVVRKKREQNDQNQDQQQQDQQNQDQNDQDQNQNQQQQQSQQNQGDDQNEQNQNQQQQQNEDDPDNEESAKNNPDNNPDQKPNQSNDPNDNPPQDPGQNSKFDPGSMTREQARDILKALEEQEKDLLKDLKKQKAPARNRNAKDW